MYKVNGKQCTDVYTKSHIIKEQEKGNFYMFNRSINLLAGTSINLLVTIPAIEHGYIRAVNSSITTNFPEYTLEIFEGGTYSGGIDVTALCKNLNRNKTDMPDVNIKSGVTVDVAGDMFHTTKLYGERKIGNRSTGDALPGGGDKTPYLFSPGSQILLKSTNNSTEDGIITSTFYFYQKQRLY